MPDYDVIVIGGGSAGTTAAAAATNAGARTALVNDGELGGLCILRGCMPTKSMLAAAHALHDVDELDSFGIHLEGHAKADFTRIMARKDGHVARFKKGKLSKIEASDYEVIDGRGSFTPEGTFEVNGREVSAASYVIATGSNAAMLPIPGLEQVPVLTSDSVMRLESQPSRLIVQGAGAIGLELGQFFARVGTEVLLVNRSPLLSRYDPECGAELRRAFEAEPRFEACVPGSIERLRPTATGLVADVKCGDSSREVEADALLMATGRDAAIANIGLEHVGLDPSGGWIEFDHRMCTSNPAIFVAGDSTAACQILHIANQEGRVAGHNAALSALDKAGSGDKKMDYRVRMSMIFTDPPYADVGMTEVAARNRGADIVVGKAQIPQTGRAITMGARFGVWKLIVDRASREVVGGTLLGPRADDVAHLISVMMFHHTRVDEILEMPWYHPTLSEVVLDLARDAIRQM